MQFEVDSDVQAVLEFMQLNIPAAKLVGVAESASQMARLLWGHNPQEPVQPCSLTFSDLVGVRPRVSIESDLDRVDADGGFAAEGDCL
jgi:hypothetical protein